MKSKVSGKLLLWSDEELLQQGEAYSAAAGEAARRIMADSGERPVMELRLITGATAELRPLILVCPGGGYSHRAEHEGAPVAAWLNGLGLHAAICHYRVAPWRFPAPLLDARRALRMVRANAATWGVDAQRVGVLGFSAGGHLAAMVATFGDDARPAAEEPLARHSARADLLVACYPVISNGSHGHQGSFRNLLGENPDSELRRRLSLEKSVTQAHPPAFIWHTANDTSVLVANALDYAGALAAAGVTFALHVYPDGRHGLGMATEAQGSVRNWSCDCAGWLAEMGWVEPQQNCGQRVGI